MSITRITVAGIRPKKRSVTPHGHHLRWMFAPEVGFPAGGFQVFRRAASSLEQPTGKLNLAELSPNQTLRSGQRIGDVGFYFPASVTLTAKDTGGVEVNNGSGATLELRFREPVTYVRVDLRKVTTDVTLRAYAGNQPVAVATPATPPSGGDEMRQLAVPFITRVVFELGFGELAAVCFTSERAACEDKTWRGPIAELPLVKTSKEALARLEQTLNNRYAASREKAHQRYGVGLPELITWLWMLQEPADAPFVDPDRPPHQLQLKPDRERHPLKSVYPQSLLLLAALDPNIARFLSLYWVDAFDRPGGPEPDTPYDYKVEGLWTDREVRCGLLFGLGVEEAPHPWVDKPVTGRQAPGVRWKGSDPLGRVNLRWPHPSIKNPALASVQPILYDVARDAPDRLITEKNPALVASPAWQNENAALFTDVDVPVGTHSYWVRGIDLFGQTGEWTESDPVPVEDLAAPPPPVRLRALLVQPGYPWRTDRQRAALAAAKGRASLQLQFEYGAMQHRQGPDAARFFFYARRDSLFEEHNVDIHVLEQIRTPNGRAAHKVRVANASGVSLADFAGGVLTNVAAGKHAAGCCGAAALSYRCARVPRSIAARACHRWTR